MDAQLAADFERLRRAATDGHWKDETPVDRTVFEPAVDQAALGNAEAGHGGGQMDAYPVAAQMAPR